MTAHIRIYGCCCIPGDYPAFTHPFRQVLERGAHRSGFVSFVEMIREVVEKRDRVVIKGKVESLHVASLSFGAGHDRAPLRQFET